MAETHAPRTAPLFLNSTTLIGQNKMWTARKPIVELAADNNSSLNDNISKAIAYIDSKSKKWAYSRSLISLKLPCADGEFRTFSGNKPKIPSFVPKVFQK